VQYLEQRVAAQFERNRELNAALEDRERKLAELTRDQSLKEKSLLVLQQQLEHLNASNDRLTGEVHALRAERDACTAAAPKDSVSADAGVAPERPQGLFDAPPERIDDLRQIRGIGDSFEHRLNELGIYQFRQIAALNESEAVWIEDALKMFRGRIGRDDWVGQALALIAGNPWLHGASTPAQHPTP
jgi:predicted flap endonuclease-1-like 5' DNA nuclease